MENIAKPIVGKPAMGILWVLFSFVQDLHST